jgi:hypothetical protein
MVSRRTNRVLIAVLAMMLGWSRLAAAAPEVALASLDHGFLLLYDLNFGGAQNDFAGWQQEHPDDPMGPVAEAAGLLFSEFNRLGVLESQFFANDSAFQARKRLAPDPEVRERFQRALQHAQEIARPRLARDANDREALFALTLVSGLNADYAALISKSNMSALRFTREATQLADRLLAIDPNYFDAYLATGMHKYIIGSMSAPVRWALRLGGISGDRNAGIADLERTAERGHFLAPFARILLAVAYLRQKDIPRARAMLSGLRQQFPNNPLFARELARLDGHP